MQVSSSENKKKFKFPDINRAMLNTILLVLIIVVISGGIGYAIGFQYGKKAGAQSLIGKVTDFLNPLNAVSDNPLFPSTTVGKVDSANASKITVVQPNGDKKNIAINSKTKITQQDKTLSVDAIKKDNPVTVFTTGKGDDLTATRIILR